MPPVTIDPGLPLEVRVDFQSPHHTAFRLFTRGVNPAGPWAFLKEGIEDSTAVTTPLPRGSALKYEFIFFQESHPFHAVLIFRQNGQVLNDGVVSVDAPGDSLFVTDIVELQ